MDHFCFKNDTATLKINVSGAQWQLTGGPFRLPMAEPILRLNGKRASFGTWKVAKSSKNKLHLHAKSAGGTWKFEFECTPTAMILRLGGTLAKRSDDIELLYCDDMRFSAEHVLSQEISMGGCAAIPLHKGVRRDFSGAVMLLLSKNDEQLRMSYPLRCTHVPRFDGTAVSGAVKHFRTGVHVRFYGKRTISAEPLSLRIGDGFLLMREYGDENSTGPKDFSELVRPGWNTWDYYRWTVTEDEVLENAEFIASDPVLSRYVKRIIVDDGWQYAYGEWDANSLFPRGMRFLADKIREMGFTPGLWIAPTLVEPHARIAQLHPEMLAKSQGGLPTLCFSCMGRQCFMLDPSAEPSREFIYNLFDRYADMGFEYFKLDFLGATTSAPRFGDPNFTHGMLMDWTIGLARKAVRGRAKLLGCNYMYSGGPDLVDAARVGGDIHVIWDCIKENTPSVAARFWSNKLLWLNDPDFALCRAPDTARDPDLTKMLPCLVFIKPDNTESAHFGMGPMVRDISAAQCEILLSLVIVSGGAVNLSDKMSRLNARGLDLARRTVSAESGNSGIPLDLFSTALPSKWLQDVNGKYARALLINWDDVPREVTLDLGPFGMSGKGARNFWTDEPVPVRNGYLIAPLAPRSCLFVTDIQ